MKTNTYVFHILRPQYIYQTCSSFSTGNIKIKWSQNVKMFHKCDVPFKGSYHLNIPVSIKASGLHDGVLWPFFVDSNLQPYFNFKILIFRLNATWRHTFNSSQFITCREMYISFDRKRFVSVWDISPQYTSKTNSCLIHLTCRLSGLRGKAN